MKRRRAALSQRIDCSIEAAYIRTHGPIAFISHKACPGGDRLPPTDTSCQTTPSRPSDTYMSISETIAHVFTTHQHNAHRRHAPAIIDLLQRVNAEWTNFDGMEHQWRMKSFMSYCVTRLVVRKLNHKHIGFGDAVLIAARQARLLMNIQCKTLSIKKRMTIWVLLFWPQQCG